MRAVRLLCCALVLTLAGTAAPALSAAAEPDLERQPAGPDLAPEQREQMLLELERPEGEGTARSSRKRGAGQKRKPPKKGKPCKRKGKRKRCGKRRVARDFNVSVVHVRDLRRKRQVLLRLQVKNRRKWAATSVRACARLNPKVARVGAAPKRGSVRYKRRSVCWIVKRVKPKRGLSRKFTVKVRRGKRSRLKVAAKVSAGNSNPVSRRFKRPAKPRKQHRRSGRRARAGASIASCVLPSRLGVVFVTDDSESMEFSDPGHLRARAISVGLDQLPDGSLAAATAFNSLSRELFGVSTVDASTRPDLKRAAEELDDVGLTDYENAFLGAQDQLDDLSGADKKAVIFLSDGAPNSEDFDANEEIADDGVPIYTIGLGVESFPSQEEVLADIAGDSGAQFYSAESAGQMQSIFARIVSVLTCGAESITETFSLEPDESKSIPFTVDPGDGEFRALASWSEGDVTVTAQRPDLTTMSPGSLLTGENFVDVPTYALLTATSPLIGGWQLVVTADEDNIDDVDVTINVFKQFLADPPPEPPAPGRHLDPCTASYPKTRVVSSDQFGGRKRVYDRAASLFQVCAGFGAPEDLEFSPGMKCALIAAAATWGGPPVSSPLNVACDTVGIVNAYRSGDWIGYAAGKACGFFSEMFAGAAGIVAAGAASPTGPGAAAVGLFTYRAMSSFLNVACGGLFDGGAAALGIKLEADHQTHIAEDVIREGKCIGWSERFGYVKWSAVDCP